MEQIAGVQSAKAPAELGVTLRDGGADVAVFSHFGECIWLCLFEPGCGPHDAGREVARWRLAGRDGDIHYGFVPGLAAGQRYGLRADGPYEPDNGHRFDPLKLLADPYARAIDRSFVWRPELAAPRAAAIDTAAFVPRCIAGTGLLASGSSELAARPPRFIYEIAVRTFTRQHPEVPLELRGTLAGLSHPALIDHLVRLGVSHVELMPVAAAVDERHLAATGLRNVWGYNPALFMALEPRLAPGGMSDLRQAVEALHDAGIGVLLDVVFNHSGEGDVEGPAISLRGLDNAVYYRHTNARPAQLVNDTGCGNTLACERAPVVRLVLDTLRRFANEAQVDGFRFDLASAVARDRNGFSPDAPVMSTIAQDPLLQGLEMIAEPWDVGAGGYQLGHFPPRWREWNDRYRDGVRRFWRGEAGSAGDFATRLAGSSDVFQRPGRTPEAGINFLAAHDGFTLRDCVSYEQRHNHANGENNRDGHRENFSWNCGVEGETEDVTIVEARKRDMRALLATLFLSRGTPLLTAGDEIGRTQGGNNNAYAQDNPVTWLDWLAADMALSDYVTALVAFRRKYLAGRFSQFLTGAFVTGASRSACLQTVQSDGTKADRFRTGEPPCTRNNGIHFSGYPDVAWWRPDGSGMGSADWEQADQVIMTLALEECTGAAQVLLAFNRQAQAVTIVLPPCVVGQWHLAVDSASAVAGPQGRAVSSVVDIPARSVCAFLEV